MKPKITVLMPVYNGEAFIREAIQSIIAQTYINFEFLIIDDGSDDQSVNIIKNYRDFRIRLKQNETNRGLVESLNKGIDLAKGEYIARMDCDDICFPERLAKQLTFMEQHLEVGVCGTWIEFTDTGQVLQHPVEHELIVSGLTQHNQLAHPSVMIRTAVLRQHHLYYDPYYTYAQDYELWVRMSKITRLANIPEVLVKYRIHPGQVSRKFRDAQEMAANDIRKKIITAVDG